MSNFYSMRLLESWKQLVSNGYSRQIVAGAAGKLIECGVRMTDRGMEHYAIDLDSSAELYSGIRKRRLRPSRFEIQLNPYRALKPRSLMQEDSREGDASDCLFACESPNSSVSVHNRHALLHIRLNNFHWTAISNLLPIESNGHFLWIPTTKQINKYVFPHIPQLLSRSLVTDFLELAGGSSDMMTFFNSINAGASVNHLHFQSVYRPRLTVLEQAKIVFNGKRHLLANYPVAGSVYLGSDQVAVIWKDVERLQEAGIPFNLISFGSATYLIPRTQKCKILKEFPGDILASMELSGTVVATDREFYASADWKTLKTALRRSTILSKKARAVFDQ